MRKGFMKCGEYILLQAEKRGNFRMAKIHQRAWRLSTYIRGILSQYCAALAGRAVALNGRQPPHKVQKGIMRNVHLLLS